MVGQVSTIWQPWLKQGGGLVVPLDISNHEDNMWVAISQAKWNNHLNWEKWCSIHLLTIFNPLLVHISTTL